MIDINPTQERPLKGFLVFGEHPREMISSETGLNLVKVFVVRVVKLMKILI